MSLFFLRLFLGSLVLCPVIGILLLSRHLFRNLMSPRIRYRLWFLLLALLPLPVLPLGLARRLQLFSLSRLLEISPSYGEILHPGPAISDPFFPSSHWKNDFFLPSGEASLSPLLLFAGILWLSGVCFLAFCMVRTALRLRAVKHSALPLKNREIREIYENCLAQAGIKKRIPLYTTAFLKSPIFTGILRPRIYLPLFVVSAYSQKETGAGTSAPARELRCLLLHELQHYRQKDAFACLLMNLAGLFYWFHPLVRFALKEMASDRELSCDAGVLDLLDETEYEAYGHTLLRFAEQASRNLLPFSPGISGSFRQIRRRILLIGSYRKPSGRRVLQSLGIFCLTSLLLLPFVPALPAYALDGNFYPWNFSKESIVSLDLASYFEGCKGSFVLYDSAADTWQIYNQTQAQTRVSPNSTYKIYDALLGLEKGVITPEHSLLPWDGSLYPFSSWNRDQNLASAMESSVNWYFQSIDRALGKDTIRQYFREIGYGNGNVSGSLSSYWREDSLKISPVEQVLLLRRLWEDGLGFDPEHVRFLKDALVLESFRDGTLYGKTGTGQTENQTYSGWFVGCLERPEGTCFFALYLQGDSKASGSRAAQTVLELLSYGSP